MDGAIVGLTRRKTGLSDVRYAGRRKLSYFEIVHYSKAT